MKKFYLAIIAVVALSACGDISIVKDNTTDNSDNSYAVSVEGNATYTNDGTGVNDPYYGDSSYDENAIEADCNASGYFYCSAIATCLNQPLTGGSCTVQ